MPLLHLNLPNMMNVAFGSEARARGPAGSGLDIGGKATFARERRQLAGLRAFTRPALSACFVPGADIPVYL
jgi:hypothetical protein